MFNEILVGVQNNLDGTIAKSRGGKQGEQLVSQLHGKYYEQVLRGNVYSVSTQGTSVTTTAALATTFTGLAVGNPAGSGVNLVLLYFTAAQLAVGAAGEIGVMGAAGSITASLTPQNRLIGGGNASKATATAGQTISTPLVIETFGQVGSLATTGWGVTPGIVAELAGSIILAPGAFIASYTAVVTTSALQFSFVWEEVPLG